MALSQSPTITKLADLIIRQLKRGEEKDSASDEILNQAKLLASQHGADVSDKSIAELAEDLQSRDAASNVQIIN
jgi:hypothetical protein